MKIRFIQIGIVEPRYQIEEKKWWGWKQLCYSISSKRNVWFPFENTCKENLLEHVLSARKTCLKFVDVVEYPTIKKY